MAQLEQLRLGVQWRPPAGAGQPGPPDLDALREDIDVAEAGGSTARPLERSTVAQATYWPARTPAAASANHGSQPSCTSNSAPRRSASGSSATAASMSGRCSTAERLEPDVPALEDDRLRSAHADRSAGGGDRCLHPATDLAPQRRERQRPVPEHLVVERPQVESVAHRGTTRPRAARSISRWPSL